MSCGILVGCDKTQEWMLSWWHANFRKHNSLPIAFIDFGMTESAKAWCKNHGYLISLKAPKNFVFPRALIAKQLQDRWEVSRDHSIWRDRHFWFCKPFALLQTPFSQTLWLDIDCEVLAPLEHLFKGLYASSIALTKDCNSGVIVYNKSSPLLSRWASVCASSSDLFFNDQEVLAHIIREGFFSVRKLASKYNWRVQGGMNPEAAILHWTGAWGKAVIRQQIEGALKK